MSTWQIVVISIGLGLITLVTRCFFFISEREIPLPSWLRQGLRYAPLAALAAVAAPELVMTQGSLITTWQDPRPYAAIAGAAYFFWRGGILGTIVSGTIVFLLLRQGLGW